MKDTEFLEFIKNLTEAKRSGPNFNHFSDIFGLIEINLLEISAKKAFISAFRKEVCPILKQIEIVPIPQEDAEKMIERLSSFYQDFEKKYPRIEPWLGKGNDRNLIEIYFTRTIRALSGRLVRAA